MTTAIATRPRRSRWRVLHRLVRNRFALVAAIVIGLLILVAILAPLLAPLNPNGQDLFHRNQGPGHGHWLGTDGLGRDGLSRLLVAARVTMVAAAQGSGIAFVLGIPAGLYAGYLGGLLDSILGRVADTLLCLPPLIFAMAIVGILGPGLTHAMYALGIAFAPRFFRLARSAAQSIRRETYIEAERAIGASTNRIAFLHVLPNAAGQLLVQVSFTFGYIITAEASLSFLGLGVQAPQASWGSMLRDAFDNVHATAFPLVPPAVMIVISILALSALGDGLRDALGRQSRRDT
jgi:peptide/nickel transport system permease protein